MMTLKEFLKTQESRLKAESEARDLLKKRWEKAVAELMATIEGWLAESDPDGLLAIKHGISTIYDDAINQPPLPSLEIAVGGRAVSIRPVAAENFVGPRLKPTDGHWSGRVDMIGHPYSFELWLFTDAKEETRWYIRNDRDYAIGPLTRESFDGAMVELFS